VLVLIGWATIMVTNLSGLLSYETARVWLFLQPLFIVPASLILSHYRKNTIMLVLLAQWIILSTMKANLVFISA